MRVLSAFLLMLLLGAPTAWAQNPSDTASAQPEKSILVQRVESAFRGGDAEILLSPAADRVEISLFGTRTFYSRAQAFYVMRDFFKSYSPRRFERDEVADTGANYFITGAYWHIRSEDPLRVYVRLRQDPEGASWALQEVRVERTRE